MTQQLIDKLNEVERRLKHQPGRHDQQKHAGSRGGGGSGELSSDLRKKLDALADDRIIRKLDANVTAQDATDEIDRATNKLEKLMPQLVHSRMTSQGRAATMASASSSEKRVLDKLNRLRDVQMEIGRSNNR
jgi:hypothetical protein